MRLNNSNFLLAELIYKSLAEDLSNEEQELLTKWKAQQENQELFEKIVNADSINEKFEIYNRIQTQDALKKVKKRISERSKEKAGSRYAQIYKYVAACVLLAGFGYLLYSLQSNGGDPKAATEQALAQSKSNPLPVGQKDPGTSRAKLILADGREVDLSQASDELKGLPGVSVNNLEKVLSYESVGEGADNNAREMGFNTLQVPVGGEYQVTLPDGSKVWLNSSSSLKYPVVFAGDQRVVELQGEAYFEVTKSQKQFVVKTGDVEVKVLGTKFNLSAYEDDATVATTLVEGKVSMQGKGNIAEAVLTPNKQAVYNRDSQALEMRPVNVMEYIAWKDGLFHFQKQELETILTRLSRWYGVSFVYADPSLKKKVFTGMARKDKPIDHILHLISKTANISYTIENSEVILQEKD